MEAMVNRDQENLAIALWVERNYGPHGPAYIAAQIGRLALADDQRGVARWTAIAGHYQDLMSGGEQ